MHLDLGLTLGGAFVGFVVGLTGMGGGALMTPMLVLFFGVQPLAAVSSDLVASAVMKPVGGGVHIRRGTVNWSLVRWLAAGSVPSAFCGVFVLRWLGAGQQVQAVVKQALGIALLLAAAALIVRAYLGMVQRARQRALQRADLPVPPAAQVAQLTVRPVPILLVGAIGGLVVGMTSVGSGSMIIIALMAIYPRLSAASLVGTDLVQAVPLVASAAVAHLLFGDFHLDVTISLLLGSIPGVFLGADASSRAPGGLVRRALGLVLLASGLKLLNVPTATSAVVLHRRGPGRVADLGLAAHPARPRAAASSPGAGPDGRRAQREPALTLAPGGTAELHRVARGARRTSPAPWSTG